MSTLAQIKKLADRYPFTEEELEILVRCHTSIVGESNEDSFMMKLALCSPYSYFFLPGDEMRKRVTFVEDHILPMGFSSELRAAVSADAFVNYANEGQELSLERFLEGIANTGRRGPKEALRVIFNIPAEPTPQEILDLCFRLSVATDALVAPTIDMPGLIQKAENSKDFIMPMVRSLTDECSGKELTSNVFFRWAEDNVPMLSSTIFTFVHNLLFHGHPYPASRNSYARPIIDHASEIFTTSDSPSLFPLSCTSFRFGGKMHRLYSSEMDGRSFNRLEWSILGYDGPTLLIIRTEEDATLGAFASMPWKDSVDFFGDSDCFLLQLQPSLRVYRPLGRDNHFMYCHSQTRPSDRTVDSRPFGLGFGGTSDKPRLFLPESLEECTADFLDSTYQAGDLLPKEAMERFQIKFLEVWGVGGDDAIVRAMRARADYRERTNTTILKARKVDKTQFVDDLQSGLIPNTLYRHHESTRGRADFQVDDEHGGYKIDRS